jgi:hypothetical protein
VWEPQGVTVAALRSFGLAPWPSAIAVWWPHPDPIGELVCRACLTEPDRLRHALAGRPDDATALVVVGAAGSVHRRCVFA